MTNNITPLKDIASELLQKDNYLILTHRHPDGDTLGSAFALCRALRKLDKNARVVCSDVIPDSFDFLYDKMDEIIFEPDYIISVDIANPQLLGEKYEHLADRIDICIDHHHSNNVVASLRYVDGDTAANCEIIYDLLKLMEVEFDKDIAACLYTGISTDTGCFKFSNTTPRSHKIAAELMEYGFDLEKINYRMFEEKTVSRVLLESIIMKNMEYHFFGRCCVAKVLRNELEKTGAKEDELDGLTGLPRQIKGVEVGVLIREQVDSGCRISVRTKAPTDASEICANFGGGGHVRAAGCTIDLPIDEAKEELLKVIAKVLGED